MICLRTGYAAAQLLDPVNVYYINSNVAKMQIISFASHRPRHTYYCAAHRRTCRASSLLCMYSVCIVLSISFTTHNLNLDLSIRHRAHRQLSPISNSFASCHAFQIAYTLRIALKVTIHQLAYILQHLPLVCEKCVLTLGQRHVDNRRIANQSFELPEDWARAHIFDVSICTVTTAWIKSLLPGRHTTPESLQERFGFYSALCVVVARARTSDAYQMWTTRACNMRTWWTSIHALFIIEFANKIKRKQNQRVERWMGKLWHLCALS